MVPDSQQLLCHILNRLRQVRRTLGPEPNPDVTADIRLGDQLDSMGLVEFVALLADDCGVSAAAIEGSVQQRFGTVRELAEALGQAGLAPRRSGTAQVVASAPGPTVEQALGWLGGISLRLPDTVQPAEEVDTLLQRPPGWLLRHAGIRRRHLWREQDPLAAATEAGLASLRETGLLLEEVGALLVTSEAPPLLAGMAAALHHRLNLRPETVALEVGGACTGFLAALWLARSLLPRLDTVLLLCVETPSTYLQVQPGPAGEAAALFGDAAAACVVSHQARGAGFWPVRAVRLQMHGDAGDCLHVRTTSAGLAEVRMEGLRLAELAINLMAEQARALAAEHGLSVEEVQAVIAHGGNGRMPALLARRLGLPPERVWSQAAATGNLGSASLPAAWAAHQQQISGPLLWTAAGAGLTGGAALTGTVTPGTGGLLEL
jgi:3-oxoacyl-[acyl-carrier-protein] synthase-3